MRYVHSQGVDEIGRSLSWYEGYYRSEVGFAWYKDFYTHASKTNDLNSIDYTAPQFRKETLVETITKYHHRKMTPKLEFEVEALVAMEVAMLPWLQVNGREVSIEEKCRWMIDIVPRELFELLNTPVMSQLLNIEPSGTHTLKIPIGTPRLFGGNHSLNNTGTTVPMQQ